MQPRQPNDTTRPVETPGDKRPIIDAIRQINHGVSLTFLAKFDEAALAEYLEQLRRAATHDLHIARRTKPSGRPIRLAS